MGQANHPAILVVNEADPERYRETIEDMSRQGTWATRLQAGESC